MEEHAKQLKHNLGGVGGGAADTVEAMVRRGCSAAWRRMAGVVASARSRLWPAGASLIFGARAVALRFFVYVWGGEVRTCVV